MNVLMMKKQQGRNNTVYWCLRIVCFVFFVIFSSAGLYAQVSIESISSAMHSGAEVVRIDLSQQLEDAPVGFSVQSPARIALDFPGVENATGRSGIEINQGNLRSINIVQAENRVRVVLSLKQYVSYRTEMEGKTVLVLLDPSKKGEISEVDNFNQIFTDQQEIYAEDASLVKDIDFRRTADGAGRVIIDLAHERMGVNMQQQGASLVLKIQDAVLPEGLRRRLDVSDFGTPVQLISTSQQGEYVHLNVELSGEWEHSAYQNDRQFVLDVRPKRVDLSKFMRGPNYTGERLSLNFQNIEVRSLLQVIADFTDFNIVTSDTVTGTLTLRLKDVPWDQALQIIMDSRGLGMRRSGTVLWIAPKEEIDERTRKEYEAIATIKKLEPLRTQAYQLNYAKAEVLLESLTKNMDTTEGAGSARFLSERGSAIAEPRTNQLFVTDIPSKLEELAELLLVLDVPVRQVLIEARIVEARDTFGRTLGVRLGGADMRTERGGDGGYKIGGNNRVSWGTGYDAASRSGLDGPLPVPERETGDDTGAGNYFVNLPGMLQNSGSIGSFALSIFNPAANRFLSLELSALEADGQGKIISSPRVITADQAPAWIEQGQEFPFVTPAAANSPATVAFKKAVLRLEVTPQITPEGDIILDLEINKDALGALTIAGPAINTKKIKTQVLVENGGTVVIGGIFESDENTAQNKIPVLGDLPVLGYLFRNKTRETEKRELLVFITPKVVSDGSNKR